MTIPPGAIDMQTAYDIESRLLAISDLTLLTITHNMSKDILELYDEIIFMADGRIIEHGTFELLCCNFHASKYSLKCFRQTYRRSDE